MRDSELRAWAREMVTHPVDSECRRAANAVLVLLDRVHIAHRLLALAEVEVDDTMLARDPD